MLAVPVTDGRIEEGNSQSRWPVTDAVLVVVNESPGIDIRLPLLDAEYLPYRWSLSDRQVGGRRKAVDDLIVPLVEDGDSPIPTGKTREGEVSHRRRTW